MQIGSFFGWGGHDGCMGRLILTLSAGVPDNAGHLVTTQEGFFFLHTACYLQYLGARSPSVNGKLQQCCT